MADPLRLPPPSAPPPRSFFLRATPSPALFHHPPPSATTRRPPPRIAPSTSRRLAPPLPLASSPWSRALPGDPAARRNKQKPSMAADGPSHGRSPFLCGSPLLQPASLRPASTRCRPCLAHFRHPEPPLLELHLLASLMALLPSLLLRCRCPPACLGPCCSLPMHLQSPLTS